MVLPTAKGSNAAGDLYVLVNFPQPMDITELPGVSDLVVKVLGLPVTVSGAYWEDDTTFVIQTTAPYLTVDSSVEYLKLFEMFRVLADAREYDAFGPLELTF